MKIQYRIQENFIEIVRCFGTDAKIELPAKITGLPVRRIAAYAFSARKAEEDSDVFEYETEESFLTEGGGELLAGENITEIIFPDTVEEIGNYIFYGCKELRKLEFSDSLTRIGSGAFTGCGRLRYLKVHLRKGKKSCVKEILGELWQRMDVTFYDETSVAEEPYVSDGSAGETIKLVFPEHYEEAVENTPARILFTQHHGTGNNYRQCFYDREMDYRKYDDLFVLATAQDKPEVLADMVFRRLGYPHELSKRHERMYESYIRANLMEIVKLLVEQESLNRLNRISERGLWSEAALDAAARAASAAGKAEIAGFLMNERHLLFPEAQWDRSARRKRFEL